MPAKLYRVKLTPVERDELNALVRKGKGVARRLTRARILLLADENQPRFRARIACWGRPSFFKTALDL